MEKYTKIYFWCCMLCKSTVFVCVRVYFLRLVEQVDERTFFSFSLFSFF